MLGRLVNEVIAEKGYEYPWGNVLPVLWQTDLFLINLECVLTTHTKPRRNGHYKPFYFRAEPSVGTTLKIGRAKFASLANNHICDFGNAGLLETIQILDQAGIAHAGAGSNLAEAGAPARLSVNGTRISVVSFADHPIHWAASPRGILKGCVNSQAVYPLSEQDGLKAQERRYTAYGKEKH